MHHSETMDDSLISDVSSADVLIVGAGMSGICMAIKLKRLGINFLIVEKASDIGGTWLLNRYPGCACDVRSALYSYSFEPNPDWSHYWSGQPEILAYLQRCVTKYELRSSIKFNTRVTRAYYDNEGGIWRLETEGGESLSGKFLVGAMGPLHKERYPDIPGRESFQGASFHTASWDSSVDLVGKRVGVIGNAASAVQLVPTVAEMASELTVFQRTPNYLLPRPNRRYSAWTKALFRTLPTIQRLHRWSLYWFNEILFGLFFKADRYSAHLAERWMLKYIEKKVSSPELLEKLKPDYRPGCKRLLFDESYYSSLQREHVTLQTEPIVRIEKDGVHTESGTHDLDVLIYATGFELLDSAMLSKVEGRAGRSLEMVYRERRDSYLGILVPEFPNFFFLLGPNSGLGHTSVLLMMEWQVNYIGKLLKRMGRHGLNRVEVRPEVAEAYQEEMWNRLGESIWEQGQCRSWYQDEKGKAFALWPGHTFEYWWRTLKPNFDHLITH